jgi:hypothetical protein
VVVLLAVLPIAADQWNKKTTVTFNAPVELPGIVLIPGTYVFKLVDSSWDRHVVQVFDADETHLFATLLAIPNVRLTPTSETVLRFEERPSGTPDAIRAWFYPGDSFGQEFVYPKARATQLAESAQVPVLTAQLEPAEKPEEMIKEPVTAITPEKTEVEIAPPPSQPDTASLVANAVPGPDLEVAPVAELPRTASSLPSVILLGLCSLGIAGILRTASKHAA